MQKNRVLCKYCGVILAFRKLILQQLWLKHDKGNFNRCNFLFLKLSVAPHCVMRCQCFLCEIGGGGNAHISHIPGPNTLSACLV